MEKTHYRKLRNPNYIGSYELMTGGEPKDLDVEIVSASKEHVQNGDKKEEAMVISLKHQKPFIVNSTNAKNIAKALGSPYIEDWAGKRITLYVAKIRAFGEYVDALRVRPVAPQAPSLPDLNPNHPKWNDALKAFSNGKTNIDAIRKSYTLNDENEKLLKDAKKA